MSRTVAKRLVVAAWLLAAGAPAHAQTLLRWKFKPGERLQYLMAVQMVTKVQIGADTSLGATIGFSYEDTWKVASVDKEGVTAIERTIDRIQMKIQGPRKKQGPQEVLLEFDSASDKEPTGMAKMFVQVAGAMVKKATLFRINARGEILEAKAPQGVLESVQKVLPGAGSFGDFFSAEGMKKSQVNISFPETPVAKGQTWTHRDDFQFPAVLGTLGVEQTYEYLGTERRNSVDLQKIGISMRMTSKEEKPSEPKQAAPLVRFKNNHSSGIIYFDNGEGRISESTMKIKLQAEINATGKQGTMEMEGSMRMDLQPSNGPRDKPKL